MKISKQILKQIILEELNELENDNEFGQTRMSSTDAKMGGLETGKAQSAEGITSQERGLIKQLSDMLVAGAEETNLLSGTIIVKIKQLAAELSKEIKTPSTDTQGDI